MLFYDASNEASEATSSATLADLRAALAEETVDVADHDGRIIRVNRRDWLEKVLMPNLRAARGDLEHLYELLVGAVVDGFAGDVIEHARYLAKHDATPPRGVALLGAVFLASGRVNDAHRELMNGLELHGEDALLLCNLARVFDAREDRPRTDATLWRSLTLDPNLDFAFAWFLDRAADGGQDGSIREACERVAALPGSWRARVVLAGAALRANNATGASRLHDEALLCAPKPVPSDLLLQMSGNLGKAGLLQELVDRVGPRFDACFHNFFIGANLMKAYLTLGQYDDAQRVFDALCKEDRPDWDEHLEEWRGALGSLRPGAAQA